MKTDIWMPWFISDYERDTKELTLEEDCVYRRALDYLWQNPIGLPSPSESQGDRTGNRTARCLRLSEEEFERTRWVLEKFLFLDAQGFYRSPRVDAEYKKSLKLKKIASEKGRKGNEVRWGKGSLQPSPSESLGQSQEDRSSPSPSPISKSLVPKDLDSTKKRTQVPGDFVPDHGLLDWALLEGFTPEEVARETPAMIDHFRGAGIPKKDWRATWRNWMRNSRKFKGKPYAGKPTESEKIKRNLDVLAEFARGSPERASVCDGFGENGAALSKSGDESREKSSVVRNP